MTVKVSGAVLINLLTTYLFIILTKKAEMRKFYTSGINAILVLFFSVGQLNAQTPPYFKGTGTATNTIPMNTAGSHCQQIYLPGDFNTLPISGLITKIYFRNTVANGTGTYTNFSVAFLQNSLTAFPNTTFLTGFTTALSQPSITINGNATAGGWYEIPLTIPFAYNNSQTLIVEIKYDSRTGGMSGYTTTATGNKRLSIVAPPGPTTGNLSTAWGDFGMEVLPGGPCTNPPSPRTVTTTANPVCTGTNFTLGLTSGSSGTGQTYQWQSSPNNSTWSDIPGATLATLTTSQSVSTWYRNVITCGVAYNTPGLQIVTPASVSGTYTINSGQPTGGTNFQTFNAAYDYISCGINGPVIFNVDPLSGPYTEQLIITPVPGASSTNTITFNGNGRILQFTSTNTNERAVIKLNGADHFRFDSLTINATATTTSEYGFGVQLLNDADSNVFRKCHINITDGQTSTNHVGISISASATSATGTGSTMCDDNLFDWNTITGGYYGITNVGSTTVANQRNHFIKNIIRDYYIYGIYSSGTFAAEIAGNDISRPARANIGTADSYGIYFTVA